jgi:hypothetical protein
MRIAQIASLSESVPPKLYGGTERVVSWLTDELVALSHDATLFVSQLSHQSQPDRGLAASWLGRPRADPDRSNP